MRNSLKYILSIQLKCSRVHKNINGFTLIELLVAMVLAVLVITPLMAFMINVLDNDRREQAKSNTEQEIQAALDYIARDLQQAVYIYDQEGITRDQTNSDKTLWGIKKQIPPEAPADSCDSNNATNCKPVLVFWKREFIPKSVGLNSEDDTQKEDGFAYSLVAYYLISNPNPNSNSPWSPTARIGRFKIRGKVNAKFSTDNKGKKCSPGFNPPPLNLTISGSKLKEKMNQWKNSLGVTPPPCPPSGSKFDDKVDTLIDYVSTTSPAVTCPPNAQGVGDNNSGFFACVNADEILAQVYLRGNALARIQNDQNPPYNLKASAYFPGGNIRVQGRGFLFTK